ncbi:hypothetical protein [Hoeflea sp.]|uniref:head-tail joining protein n=1 Tax=Hoeflea sp. TaxID=1940281 RepID=UPI0019CD85FC|nr:hypothetical protein [Hoeflea sp.]MBC7282670.1 hypothetical protein [Hoeflea sp.]
MSDARAQRAIDAAFRAFGRDAVYTPAGGDPVEVRVLFPHPDRIAEVAGIRHVGPSQSIELRKSEVAAPKQGDIIEIDGKSYKLGQPMQPDARRLKWSADISAV